MNAAFDELKTVLEEREHEITERTASLRAVVSELDRLSRTDAMTGCLNYRGFTEAGERLWQEARASGAPLSVLALDIDHFKRYNDLYGHAEGDSALRRFAGAVRSALLHADDVLARPGGARASPCSCRPPTSRRRCRWAGASANACAMPTSRTQVRPRGG